MVSKIKQPAYISRIDRNGWNGWQVRYAGISKSFSDHKLYPQKGKSGESGGRVAALTAAKNYLLECIASMPALTGLQKVNSKNKGSKLPVGISLSCRHRTGLPNEYYLTMNLPRFGIKPLRRSMYIANANTYTQGHYDRALNVAIVMRNNATTEYQGHITAHNRRKVADL